MPALVIRGADPDDAPAIRAVHQASVRGLCAAEYTPAEIEAWVGAPRPDAGVADPQERRWVATRAGRVVGFAALRGDEVWAVYVHPEAARQGVGSALLAAVERAATDAGGTRLNLSASLTAVPFYHANGYRTVRESVHTLRTGVPMGWRRRRRPSS